MWKLFKYPKPKRKLNFDKQAVGSKCIPNEKRYRFKLLASFPTSFG
jgi:hypothetical protein